jgi:hypothetical protein
MEKKIARAPIKNKVIFAGFGSERSERGAAGWDCRPQGGNQSIRWK